MENLSKMKNNNYPNWLVPIEIAQELKAIGFDEPCHFYYQNDYSEYLKAGDPDKYHIISDSLASNGKNANHNNSDIARSAPTWEQVFEWFRDKGFMITLINYEDESKFSFYNMKIRGGVYYAEAFKTYEQAREELVYKLIEIYKS